MKRRLRKEFRQIRDSLVSTNAAILLQQNFLKAIQLNAHSKIGSYFPINSEIEISNLNESLHDAGHEVYLPCNDYKFRNWQPNCEMAVGKFPEPINTQEILPTNLDIIIVPLIAFDENKNRLGYGGGYYDRILQNTNALKIGVAYDIQKSTKIPTEEHDIKLDMVVTEANIYK